MKQFLDNALHKTSKVVGLIFFCLGLFSYVLAVETGADPASVTKAVMELKSSAFGNGVAIPEKHTCDGENLSPPLSWEGSIPEGTESFVIICYDSHPIANNWVHWMIYNIPVGTVKLEEGFGKTKMFNGVVQGRNTFGNIGYSGPCPPPNTGIHRYHFLIYALDIPMLSFKKDYKLVDRQDIDAAMQGHILGKGELIGTYSK